MDNIITWLSTAIVIMVGLWVIGYIGIWIWDKTWWWRQRRKWK